MLKTHIWTSATDTQLATNNFQTELSYVRVELALQKPLITHEPRMVQPPNLEDRLFYERQ